MGMPNRKSVQVTIYDNYDAYVRAILQEVRTGCELSFELANTRAAGRRGIMAATAGAGPRPCMLAGTWLVQ